MRIKPPPAAVYFKHEDEVGGVPLGPVYVMDDEGTICEDLGWESKPFAMGLAKKRGLEFKEG